MEPTSALKKAGAELAKLSGSNFDKAVMDKVVAASSESLTAYQDAAQSTDPQIKSFAAQMLPLAEEKRHIVEKMTGAGSKTANQIFRITAARELRRPRPPGQTRRRVRCAKPGEYRPGRRTGAGHLGGADRDAAQHRCTARCSLPDSPVQDSGASWLAGRCHLLSGQHRRLVPGEID